MSAQTRNDDGGIRSAAQRAHHKADTEENKPGNGSPPGNKTGAVSQRACPNRAAENMPPDATATTTIRHTRTRPLTRPTLPPPNAVRVGSPALLLEGDAQLAHDCRGAPLESPLVAPQMSVAAEPARPTRGSARSAMASPMPRPGRRHPDGH